MQDEHEDDGYESHDEYEADLDYAQRARDIERDINSAAVYGLYDY